jgi:adenylate cyclase
MPQRHVNLQKVEEVSRLVSTADDMDALIGVTLDACRDLLDCHHSFVMLVDESGERLYTVASTGYPSSGTGSEVRVGDGIIGVAAASRQSVRVTNMARELSYTHAARSPGEPGRAEIEQVIPLPGLPHAQSQLVTPMLAYHGLVGVMCLQSEAVGAFSAADECIAGILASQVAMAMARLKDVEAQPESQPAAEPAGTEPRRAHVKHYQEDDSVFLDNEYLIKGVAGGILWRLLRVYEEEGRTEFSNKEIRLDQTLDLPDIKDHLEARLILLRKRLEERSSYLRIEKTARGRFRLVVTRPLALTSIEGGGPL